MIKINLLPHVSKKRIEFKRQVLLSGIFLLVLLGLILQQYISKSIKLSYLIALKEAKTMELQSLQYVQAKVKKLKRIKTNLKNKINVIQKLEATRSGPVKLLYTINLNIPEYLWLTKLTKNKNTVELTGEALSHAYPADFVSNLRSKKDIFGNVELIYTKEKQKLGDISVITFGIKCLLTKDSKQQTKISKK